MPHSLSDMPPDVQAIDVRAEDYKNQPSPSQRQLRPRESIVHEAPSHKDTANHNDAANGSAPLGLLPTPTAEEVAGFIQLYERKYGATLDSAQAMRVLSGLVRFLYLTRTASPAQKTSP